ncbi:ATP synthase subunit I [Thioclava atlantica]|uniref:N-ATPase, AtpR subunit n=1 Tax=Thioclava atlantica TaxID=1317124 RepID=A0A085TZZ4_9RHOB|nr:ATP synthase subunit I [Thioclava atlantica]KFE36291.1 hypothetical protein DW2_03244 [Thioclava atlantica]
MTSPVLLFALALVLGFILGLFHFGSLKRVSDLYLGGRGVGLAIALQLARLALLVVVMVWLAREGALPLLAAALGLILARVVVLRFTKGQA